MGQHKAYNELPELEPETCLEHPLQRVWDSNDVLNP